MKSLREKKLKQIRNSLFYGFLGCLTALSAAALLFVIIFITKEALPAFSEIGVIPLLFGTRWMPAAYTGEVSFGIGNFLASTIAVSAAALLIAMVISIGAALFLSCRAGDRTRAVLYPMIDLLAGIPSVIYGFIGLVVLVKWFRFAGVHTGSCVLAAAILLAVMLLPYLIASCSESMRKIFETCGSASSALGCDRWYFALTVVLPASFRSILLSLMLALGRAMGETMAVMMVIGNANLFPKLLGKGETIAGLIALEMGTAEAGSLHYHALYAAGFVLMFLLFLIHAGVSLLRRHAERLSSGIDSNADSVQRIRRARRSSGVSLVPGVSRISFSSAAPYAAKLVRIWADVSMLLVIAVILYLFGYIFVHGAGSISWSFLTEAPKGAVLGEEGGIFPAITGSLAFTLTAVVLGGIPAVCTALYLVFYCKSRRIAGAVRLVIQCISGIPSIVLGLFAYSVFARDLGLGRCILTAGIALAVMVLPFIEVRAEKAFLEFPDTMLRSSYALGCSRRWTIFHLVLPECRGELASGIILGACYAMGATAPVMFTGAVAYAGSPSGLFDPAMALPLHLYLLIAQGAGSIDTAYGTALVMMAILLISSFLANLTARRRHR